MTSRSVVRRLLAACYVLVGVATLRVDAISSPWRPISPPIATASIIHREAAIYGNLQPEAAFDVDSAQRQIVASSLSTGRNHCALYKVSMAQQLYFEYIHYKIDLPDIKEFTLCMWAKFHNHTNDHPLFSYAVDEQPRGILFWVANTPRSSYYMMNVDGHNLYRLNYPLRLNKWYHSCQSWNGRTGEWQIWVNDERVGRGFNNRLVGHVIKGGGIAITGQEQRQLGGGFLEGEGAPPGSGGMLGEVTMVQLYNIALTAGKAHRDHKHHHAHHYEHDVTNNAPRSTTRSPMTVPPLTSNPFLTGGQINTQVKINPGAPLQIVQNGVILRHPALPVPREPSPQPFPPANPDSLSTAFPLSPSIPRPVQDNRFYASSLQQSVPNNIGSTDSAISFVDNAYRNLFKREKSATKRRSSANEEADGSSDLEKPVTKREINGVSSEESTSQEAAPSMELNDEKKLNKRDSDKKKKRGLIPFSDSLFLDDGYSVPQGLENDYFSGLANFGLQLPQQHETKDEEREPAEAEVKQVMDICSGCAEEPFEKALIMGWRSVPKKIYSGAYYLPAIPACKAF